MNRKLTVTLGIVSIVVLSILAVKALAALKKPETQKPPAELYREVQVDNVEYNTVTTRVTSTGRVTSGNTVDLIAEVQGKLLPGDIPFKKGQAFSKSDVLVRLYSKDAGYALQSRKSRFLNALALILPDLKMDYADSYQAWDQFFQHINIESLCPSCLSLKTNKRRFSWQVKTC
ncbi:MAG: hypothetical protein HC896_16100 [Bacteroidales bacterium]|nr:hypothetical protein [Bacteroidales bacterium]